MNLGKLTDIAQGVARAHIVPLGFTLSVEATTGGATPVASNGMERHRENLCLESLPEDVQGEYVHCAAHALCARVIATRCPA